MKDAVQLPSYHVIYSICIGLVYRTDGYPDPALT
jgi:hypothetical protein